jgi:2-dehydropantoate 2-reductase
LDVELHPDQGEGIEEKPHQGVESRLAGTFTLPVKATDNPSEVAPVDLILFCVKTYDVDTAAESRIAQAVGHDSGIGTVAYIVSTITAPGVVTQTAWPGEIVFGELGGGTSPRTQRLHDVQQRAGIVAELHPNIQAAIWQKFLFICAFSGVTAVTRLPIGTILADPVTHALFRGTSVEVEAVAHASEIDLPADCVEQALAPAAEAEPWASSSLYRDLAGGRRLELESLNGEVVRRGREHGVETPINYAIYAALRPYFDGALALP